MKVDIQDELFDFSAETENSPGILIYQNDATGVKLDVRLEGDTVWLTQLDNLLTSIGEQVLEHSGHISHEQAMQKAEREYRIYQQIELSPVERDYLESISSNALEQLEV